MWDVITESTIQMNNETQESGFATLIANMPMSPKWESSNSSVEKLEQSEIEYANLIEVWDEIIEEFLESSYKNKVEELDLMEESLKDENEIERVKEEFDWRRR